MQWHRCRTVRAAPAVFVLLFVCVVGHVPDVDGPPCILVFACVALWWVLVLPVGLVFFPPAACRYHTKLVDPTPLTATSASGKRLVRHRRRINPRVGLLCTILKHCRDPDLWWSQVALVIPHPPSYVVRTSVCCLYACVRACVRLVS